MDRNRLDQKMTLVLEQPAGLEADRFELACNLQGRVTTVRIERAAMGSFLLQKSSGSSSMRVKRID